MLLGRLLLVALLIPTPAWAARYALVDATGRVSTVVEANSPQAIQVPADWQVVEVPENTTASTGATYAAGVFTPPATPTQTLIERKLDAAIDANLAYLALSPPTTAQALAQVGALTRQVNGLLRIMRNRLDSAD
jgi:hypothetical protein